MDAIHAISIHTQWQVADYSCGRFVRVTVLSAAALSIMHGMAAHVSCPKAVLEHMSPVRSKHG